MIKSKNFTIAKDQIHCQRGNPRVHENARLCFDGFCHRVDAALRRTQVKSGLGLQGFTPGFPQPSKASGSRSLSQQRSSWSLVGV